MRILILGGTVFLGRHLAEAALERGHTITLFNRGQHNPELFPNIEKLRGDRDGGMDTLQGRTWDAVIDTCGYFPRIVRQSAQQLANAVGHYTFISSISVYADFRTPRQEETAPLGFIESAEAETATKITNENYGPLKVRCEEAVEAALPERTLLVRPGMIVGPHDPTDRFTYWPTRVARGGEMLVPGSMDQRFEIIDVRDLADWNIRLIEDGLVGAYNATGPDYPLMMQGVLETCRAISRSDVRFHNVPGEFLRQEGLDPNDIHSWWIAEEDAAARYAWDINCDKAIASGLTYRPLADTVRDLLAWDATRPADAPRRLHLETEREKSLLRAWYHKNPGMQTSQFAL